MSFPTFFSRGVHNTLLFKNGGQFLYKGPWTSIFTDTEIDRWFVGDFASATYTITVEVDSNKKEVLQVLVVARPDEANCVVYGRVAIDDEIVTVSASVNDSYVSVKLSTTIAAFNGAKAIYHVAYSGTINNPVPPVAKSFLVPDTQPDPDPGSGSGGVGSGSTVVLTSLSSHLVPSQDATYNLGTANTGWDNLYIKDTIYFGNTPLSLTNGDLNLPQGTLIDGESLNYFGRITVPGEFDVLPSQPNDVLTLRSGDNVTITTDPVTKEIIINSSGGGGAATVSTSTSNAGPSFGVVAVSGQASVIADRDQDQLTLIAGANITLTTDAATDSITISSTGGGGAGGTASTVIVNPTTSGVYPITMASGLSSISGNLLYGNSGVTIDIDNDTINSTAARARFADLAEKYTADADYPPGMVLMFGGSAEVTQAKGYENRKVAGVVSTNPAFIMNSDLESENVTTLALQGRAPCNVIGKIERGDLLVVSDIPGVATASSDPKLGSVIGKALEEYNSTDEVGVIEVVVGRI